MNVTLPWTVSTNATLINNGDIYHFGTAGGNLGLTVNGVLQGVGRILQDGYQASSDVRVTIDAGGSLMIGNSPNEIATTHDCRAAGPHCRFDHDFRRGQFGTSTDQR